MSSKKKSLFDDPDALDQFLDESYTHQPSERTLEKVSQHAERKRKMNPKRIHQVWDLLLERLKEQAAQQNPVWFYIDFLCMAEKKNRRDIAAELGVGLRDIQLLQKYPVPLAENELLPFVRNFEQHYPQFTQLKLLKLLKRAFAIHSMREHSSEAQQLKAARKKPKK